MDKHTALDALAALAQESRLDIFRRLVRAGPPGLAAGRIGQDLGLASATLSFHLKELTQAGLLHRRRAGRSIIYAADFGVFDSLIAYLLENCCGDRPEGGLSARLPETLASVRQLQGKP